MASITLPAGVTLSQLFEAYTLEAAGRKPAKKALKRKKADIPLPSLKNIPNGANEKAVSAHWREFVKKYKKVWSKQEDPERQWACCVAIWVNYCLKRKLQPFDANAADLSQETKDKLQERVESARTSQLRLVNKLLVGGKKRDLVSRLLKETLASVEETKRGVYTITSRMALKLAWAESIKDRDFRDFMAKENFRTVRGGYIRDTRTNTSVRVGTSKDDGKDYVFLVNSVTSAFAEMLLGIPSGKGNNEKIKVGLTRYWKKLIKSHPLE